MKVTLGRTMLGLIALAAILVGCGGQKAVQTGDTVQVSYVGTLEDGSIFDSTDTGDYIEFIVGSHQVIPGFESAVIGMKPGETKEITLSSDEAYGPHRPELTHEIPRSEFPDSIVPAVGMAFTLPQPDGRQIQVRITDVKGDSLVVLDANHPLAGQTLHFKLTLVKIIPKAG